MSSNNKRIVKNTILLYIRMFVTMIVGLYTSRVVLKTLGVEDYGTYSVVGGIVALFAFLNSALSNATSRFLTYELGRKNFRNQRNVFSISLIIHGLLAIFIIILGETIGVWYIYHKLVVAPDRLQAAVFAFHFSVAAVAVTVCIVPYKASIIAYERMGIFAYISILEVCLKLFIVYLLVDLSYDKLKTYSILMFAVSFIIALIYSFYSIRNFKECRFKFDRDPDLFKSLVRFSVWSLSGSFAYTLVNQGSNIVLNLFFGPVVNASKAIAAQVNMVINNFATNFRTAVNPQIVKLYAKRENNEMKKLAYNTTKFSFFLLLLIELPFFLEAEFLLKTWLGELPIYVVLFVRLTLIDTLISIFDVSFYAVLVAINRIKENAIISPTLGIVILPVAYILYKMSYGPEVIFYLMIVKSFFLSFVIKPWLLLKYTAFKYKDFFNLVLSSLIVLFVSIIPPILCLLNFHSGWLRFLFVGSVSLISVLSSVYIFGVNSEMRKVIFCYIKKRFCASFSNRVK